jgi:photosystem II stability/assembly factor-like uncharacterized protein
VEQETMKQKNALSKHPSGWPALIAAVSLAACVPSGEAPPLDPQLEEQTSGTRALLQAVSVVDVQTVWASGHEGTFARTVDGGATWQSGVVPGAAALQFRDVHAVDATTAYLLSAGPGDMSRIFKTTDAGRTWELQFQNDDPDAFFDCLDFWDAQRGLAFSDAVNGRLIVIRTENGGAQWDRVPAIQLPAAREGEGGFAASGTCLVVYGRGYAWIGTGAGGGARVFRTTDWGLTWSVHQTPVVSGTGTSGITSLGFWNEARGIALGGELGELGDFTDNVATTADGGETWTLGGRPTFAGAIYGSSLVPDAAGVVVAVGPRGASISSNEGMMWTALDSLSYWAVGFAAPDAGWMVGPEGRITKVRLYQ